MGQQSTFRSDLIPTLLTRRVIIGDSSITSTLNLQRRPIWLSVSANDSVGISVTRGSAATSSRFAGVPILEENKTYEVGGWLDQAVPVRGTVCRVSASGVSAGSPVWRGNSGLFQGTPDGDPHAVLLETPSGANNFSVLAVLTGK